eukprot:4394856-Alexandrium_andersonii.AAC.1
MHTSTLDQALRTGDHRTVHDVSRMMSGKHGEPRQRKYRAVPKSAASASEWAERMARTGPEGGCSARSVTWEQMVAEARESRAVY